MWSKSIPKPHATNPPESETLRSSFTISDYSPNFLCHFSGHQNRVPNMACWNQLIAGICWTYRPFPLSLVISSASAFNQSGVLDCGHWSPRWTWIYWLPFPIFRTIVNDFRSALVGILLSLSENNFVVEAVSSSSSMFFLVSSPC